MTDEQVAAWLEDQWRAALESDMSASDPEVDRLVDSQVLSIRYAVLTQLLGKVADASRDLLCLQRGDAAGADESGRWDPRGFCTSVVVPWVRRNRDVLGASGDPYVSNPLRRPRLDGGEALQRRGEWDALVGFLQKLEAANDPAAVERAARRCLDSAARRLNKLIVEYPSPMRIGLEQMCDLLDEFLAVSSHGLRPLIVATALMRVLGEAFSLFPRVEGQGLNEPDAAKGMPADIMCYGPDDTLRLAVEVKDRNLTLIDIDTTLTKARSSGLANVVLAAPGVRQQDGDAIRDRLTDEWARGTNVYRISLPELVRNAFVLLEEGWRVRFVKAVGAELDERGAEYPHRHAWSELLAKA